MLVFTFLLQGGLNQIMFLFIWRFGGLRCVNESGAEYPLFLSAVSYSVFAVLKISSLDELSDSRLLT